MRILMLAQFYPPVIGGEERHVRNLSQALSARGHAVDVATLDQGGERGSAMDGDVRVTHLTATLGRVPGLHSDGDKRQVAPFPDPGVLLGLRRLLKSVDPQIIHAHNWLGRSFVPLRRRFDAPLVLTLHDYGMVCAKKSLMFRGETCPGPDLLKCLGCASEHYGIAKGTGVVFTNCAMARLEARSVNLVLAVSRAVADGNRLAIRGLPFDVVPNFLPDHFEAIETPRAPRLNDLPGEPFILFVGDIRRLKGVDVLLKAYSMLKGPPPLVLIGRPGDAMPSSVPAGVTIIEGWPHALIMEAWRRSLFGVVPSIWPEPCATVVLEAMSVGRPVLASDIGGTPDMIEHGVDGMLVPPGDAHALAASMASLTDSDTLRCILGAAAKVKVRSFQAHAVVPRIEAHYQGLLDRSAA